MTKEEAVAKIKDAYPEQIGYILDVLSPYEWEHISFETSIVHIKDDMYYIDDDAPVVILNHTEKEFKDEYGFDLYLGIIPNSIEKHAVFKMATDLYWRVSYKIEEEIF